MPLRIILPAAISLVAMLSVVAAAQEPATPSTATPQVNQTQGRTAGPRREMMRARKRVAGRERRDGLRQLNLSDEQKQQRHVILERHMSAMKSQRDQLFQLRQRRLEGSLTAEDRERVRSMRQELRASMQGIRGELRNTLTAEQRAQVESRRTERKQRRGEIMRQRQEFRRVRPQE